MRLLSKSLRCTCHEEPLIPLPDEAGFSQVGTTVLMKWDKLQHVLCVEWSLCRSWVLVCDLKSDALYNLLSFIIFFFDMESWSLASNKF